MEVRGVTRTIVDPSPVSLVRDISLDIRAGEFVAITGPSGSGKSSLLYLLGLLDRPSKGIIRLEGHDTAALNAHDLATLRLARLGFVFQFHFLLPEFTARQNVMLPMRKLAARPEAEIHRRADALLDQLGLKDFGGKTPDRMSGGERQRVAIARALANEPALILADEPTGNLDTRNADIVWEIFTHLAKDNGISIIVVTHNTDLARRCMREIRLRDGMLVG